MGHDQEMKSLPIELQRMRHKKMEIEKENNDLFNSKMELQKQVNSLKKTISRLEGETAEISTINKELMKRRKEKDNEFNNKKNEALGAIERSKDTYDMIDEDRADLDKKVKVHFSNVAKLDQRQAALNADIRNLNKKEQVVEDKKKELEKIIASHNKILTDNNNIQIALDDKLAKMSKELSETKTLKTKLCQDIREIAGKKETLKARENSVLLRENKCREADRRYDIGMEIIEADKKVICEKEKAVKQKYAEMDKERDQLEILSLKIEKLASDKGLKDEIKKLRKAIK